MFQNLRKTLKRSVASGIHLITDYRLLITAGLCLTGCMGVYEGGFECPPGIGVGCKSISEVNQMVEQGELPKKQNEPQTPCQQCNSNPDFPQSRYEDPIIWYSPWVLEGA